MKSKALLPFVIILAIGGGWLFTQRQSISLLERETEALSEQIKVAQSVAGRQPKAAAVPAQAEEVKFDWKKSLAEQTGSNSRQFRKGVEAMSGAEISAALDEIATMDLPEETRNQWARRFLPALATKDPQAALARFYKAPKSRDENSFPDQYLTIALGNWAKTDPKGATSWLDARMAESDLSNKSISGFSQYQVSFEAALFRVFLSSDPTTAGKRLMALSENEAASVISYQSFNGRDVDTVLLAKLTRDSLSEAKRVEVFTNQAQNVAKQLEDVSGFLELISASPIERNACVQGAASRNLDIIGQNKKITIEDVDAVRKWARANQSGPIETITGKAIGDIVDDSSEMTFNDAYALVMNYYNQSPNDEIIMGFLDSRAGCRCTSEQRQTVLTKIADPAKRAEAQKKFN